LVQQLDAAAGGDGEDDRIGLFHLGESGCGGLLGVPAPLVPLKV